MTEKIEYKVERRIVKTMKKRKWLFFAEYENIPMWCLVKYVSGTRYDFDCYGWCDNIDYNYAEVLLKSEDEAYIKQEFKNFTESCDEQRI